MRSATGLSTDRPIRTLMFNQAQLQTFFAPDPPRVSEKTHIPGAVGDRWADDDRVESFLPGSPDGFLRSILLA